MINTIWSSANELSTPAKRRSTVSTNTEIITSEEVVTVCRFYSRWEAAIDFDMDLGYARSC